jgi:hypothetical protein
MKTIRKNLLLLAFAVGALFLIGNNVFADDPTVPIIEPPGGGFDNGKKTHITPMGNFCCCPSVQSFCNDMHYNCTSTFCSNNP